MPGGKQAGKRFSAPAPLPCRGVPSPDSAYLYVNDLERGKFFHWGVQFLWLWPAGTFETRAKMPELRLLRLLSTCLILWTYDLHLNVSEWMCAQSCLTLCDPMACSPPGSSVHGICHTRILEQVAISYSRESSQPRDGTCVSCVFCIGGWFFFNHCAIWEARCTWGAWYLSTEHFPRKLLKTMTGFLCLKWSL